MTEHAHGCLGSGLTAAEEAKLGADEEGPQPAAAFNGNFPGLAVWRGAPNGAYTPANRPHDYPIDYVVIHYTAGMSYPVIYGTGLAHYEVSPKGEMGQRVGNAYIAWHAGNWWINCRSIGIEHVGYGRPGDWTDAMLRGSARLTAAICKTYGIPIDRDHIFGHSEVQGATHTDVGPYFPWKRYIELVRYYAA